MKTLQQIESNYRSALKHQFGIRDILRNLVDHPHGRKRREHIKNQIAESSAYCLDLRDKIESAKLKLPRGKNKDRIKELKKIIEDAKKELKSLQ